MAPVVKAVLCVSVPCAGAESGAAEAAGGDACFRAAADGHSRRGELTDLQLHLDYTDTDHRACTLLLLPYLVHIRHQKLSVQEKSVA